MPRLTIPRTLPAYLVCLFTLLLGFSVGLQNYFLGPKDYGTGLNYTHYNNYKIFTNSFHHLISGKNLYQYWWSEQWDLFKYSPTFALFMAPFAMLPNWLGVSLWSTLNMLVPAMAMKRFADKYHAHFSALIAFVLIELITSVTNCQVNGLIAGMLIFAFLSLESGRPFTAVLLITGTVFIKLFGIIAVLLFLFYPSKWKIAVSFTVVSLVLLIAPCVVVSPEQLLTLYKSWGALLWEDRLGSTGMSVTGLLTPFIGSGFSSVILVIGALLLTAPLIRVKSYASLEFRKLFLSSLLIWIVIFNHKAESPTFIIAVAGVAVWCATTRLRPMDWVLIFMVLIFTQLSASDIFPSDFRHNIMIPYAVKALPCFLVWLRIVYNQFSLLTV